MPSVGEYFADNEVTLMSLAERENDNQYWESCFKFVADTWDKPVGSLSDKQINWLDKIIEGMREYENR